MEASPATLIHTRDYTGESWRMAYPGVHQDWTGVKPNRT